MANITHSHGRQEAELTQQHVTNATGQHCVHGKATLHLESRSESQANGTIHGDE